MQTYTREQLESMTLKDGLWQIAKEHGIKIFDARRKPPQLDKATAIAEILARQNNAQPAAAAQPLEFDLTSEPAVPAATEKPAEATETAPEAAAPIQAHEATPEAAPAPQKRQQRTTQPAAAMQPGGQDAAALLASIVAAPLAAQLASDTQKQIDALRADLAKLVQANKPTVTAFQINGAAPVQLPQGETEHAALKEVLEYIACGLNVYLTGPAGSGKTTAAEQAAKVLFPEANEEHNGRTSNARFASLSCSDDISAGDIYGRLLPILENGEKVLKFCPAPFLDIYQHGGIFLFDEIDTAAPEVLININKALSQDSIDVPNAGRIYKHPRCYLMAAGNTTGQGATADYSARAKLDAATLNRFVFVRVNYDLALENRIIDAEAGDEARAQIVKTARDRIRQALAATRQKGIFFSLRQCRAYARLLKVKRVQDVNDIAAHFARALDDKGQRDRFLAAI